MVKAMTKQTNNPLGSVVGYDKQIRRLTEILNIVNHADRYETFDIETPKSLLLYGEIDVGKTFMARAFADGCERNVLEITESYDSYKKLVRLCYNNCTININLERMQLLWK